MLYLLHHLLASSARTHSDSVAIQQQERAITYTQLDEISNQLANTLNYAGIERGDRVGIYLDKSIESVIAIFGILKAGATYVPLDSNAPVKRIAFIVKNCQIKILITTKQRIDALGNTSLADLHSLSSVILTDEDERTSELFGKVFPWSEVLQAPCSPPLDPHLIENDLAYILYTSGSTGTPKGVMISHRASLTFVNWAYDTFQVTAEDRVSSHAPFHFDLSIFDIFTTIKAGGTVILLSAALSVFPINLAKFIAAERISIWYSVPSILTNLVLYGRLEQHTYPDLRSILFAGEVFPNKYLHQLMVHIPDAGYYNLYGPTETNVCTYYRVSPPDIETSEAVPIGQACANTEVFVLGTSNELVARGEVGELCVRGPGLMTGYWDLPEKTAQVLVPFTLHHGLGSEMIYRTGDLVKQSPEGDYIFLGRRDRMIKSRGYRIELGEIESVLYSHPALAEVAVIPIPDNEISNRIKAFVVTRGDNKDTEILNVQTLKSFCAERLPKYMVPDLFEFRSSLPQTSTGKIDKVQLSQETVS
ncbi:MULTISPECIES: amino acid adenylation domain-containing protein [Nostocales]|jgi:amino acid adenylation domain-containing protein|uniref:AnaC n=10 Tax=Cyanobacteriota TaxID=1117 RepID=G4XG25_9NOST|nr:MULTISPECIES: amino acid adenylation domain-containing protein [Nostocales]AEQ38168.1 AnaC [Anabaena sp. 37]ALB42321.1 proline adenylation protein [Anabaena sp. WA102]MBD2277307.1 amino acid adenylation domain-containing protein [Aphanizomenon flos-aquae FACHB-1040]MBO1063398.1 amino acid adenylation domain-containing protein [Anabaena sp. 54]MTJ42340.1 amino acid adenylation domain-containing protein [Dolichospermum flos-aquae UHCC 0037]